MRFARPGVDHHGLAVDLDGTPVGFQERRSCQRLRRACFSGPYPVEALDDDMFAHRGAWFWGALDETAIERDGHVFSRRPARGQVSAFERPMFLVHGYRIALAGEALVEYRGIRHVGVEPPHPHRSGDWIHGRQAREVVVHRRTYLAAV